jgi:DNA-binding HxlR family transcriptional regulator
MDRHGMTIAGDKFQLTTTGSEPMQMETIISELRTMTRWTYGQYCGLSRAMEMVGEPWGLLLIRDLLVGPKTAAELHRGFPLIPAELLTTRLKELEFNNVVRRQAQPNSDGAEVYELTEYGAALEDVVLALGLWGAMSLAQPRPEDIVTADSLIMALRTTFQPEAAGDLTAGFELRIADIVLHAKLAQGKLELGKGGLPDADIIIELGKALKLLMTRELGPAEALETGRVQVTGDSSLLARFVDMFKLPKLP